MTTEIAEALKGTPAADILVLTEALYLHLRTEVAAGNGTHADIRALNMARKEIDLFKKQGE